MLKITAIGNLTREVKLKVDQATGRPCAVLRIASDRRYRDQAGNKITDFISIKVYDGPPARFPHQGQRCGVPLPQAGGRGGRGPPHL